MQVCTHPSSHHQKQACFVRRETGASGLQVALMAIAGVLVMAAGPALGRPLSDGGALAAAMYGRWESQGRRLLITRTRLVLGSSSNAPEQVRPYRVVGAGTDGFRIVHGPDGDQTTAKFTLQGDTLIWTEQMSPRKVAALNRLARRTRTAGEVVDRSRTSSWGHPDRSPTTWLGRAETAVDLWISDGDVHSELAEILAESFPDGGRLVDSYTQRDRGFLQVNLVLDKSEWPWAIRLNALGEVQAGFAHRGRPVETRDFVQFERPFSRVDIPQSLLKWLRGPAFGRLLDELGRDVRVQPSVPGLPAIHLFDSVEEVRRACPDLRPTEPELGMVMFASSHCGDAWLGREFPLRFGFHDDTLRWIDQWIDTTIVNDRADLIRRSDTLGRSACEARQAAQFDGGWRCEVTRGQFFTSVGRHASAILQATVLPPMGASEVEPR